MAEASIRRGKRECPSGFVAERAGYPAYSEGIGVSFNKDTGLEMARDDRKVWTSGTQGWHLPKGVNQKKPSTRGDKRGRSRRSLAGNVGG